MKEEKKEKGIRINDRYVLMRDSQSMWLVDEHKEITKGKNKGKKQAERVSGYHRTFGDLLVSLDIRLELSQTEATTLQELAEEQKRIHEEIRELCKGLKCVEELNRKENGQWE